MVHACLPGAAMEFAGLLACIWMARRDLTGIPEPCTPLQPECKKLSFPALPEQSASLPAPLLWTIVNMHVLWNFTHHHHNIQNTEYISEVKETRQMMRNQKWAHYLPGRPTLKRMTRILPKSMLPKLKAGFVTQSVSQSVLQGGYFVKIISMFSDGCPAKNTASAQKQRHVLEIAPFGLHRCAPLS